MTLMKKAFLLTASFILFAFLFSSCKKNKDEKSQTVAERLQHNWTVDSLTSKYHDASGDDIQTINGVAGDFIDFKANGTLTSHFDGEDGMGNYSIISDTEISINGETITLKTLTNTKLVLYSKYVDPDYPGEYEEQTINLSRK